MGGPSDLYRDIWARALGSRGATPERLPAAARHLPAEGRVLDVGCGDGSLARLLPGARRGVVGVDLVLDALRVARKDGVRAVQADLRHPTLPFRSGSIDAVVSLDVIEHLFDPTAFLDEARRLLRPDGLLVLSTPNARFIAHVAGLLLRGRAPRTSYDPEGFDGGHLHYFTFRDLRELVESRGFRVEAEEGIAYRDYRSLRLRLFACAARLWERQVRREFFSLGILLAARRTREP